MTEKTKHFLQRLKDSDNWDDNYDYSKVEFSNVNNKVLVIDSEFKTEHLISPFNLLNSTKCGSRNAIDKNEYFIKRSNKIHDYFYDYSKLKYLTNKDKVVIICPIHGEFEQKPDNHLMGNKCPDCSSSKKLSNLDFINKSRLIHLDTYDYSKTEYLNMKNKVIITCKIHGDFTQSPGSHLRGQKCSKCTGNSKHTNESIIKKFNNIHGDRYNYNKVEYTGISNKVIIVCKIHGDFEQTPESHSLGKGCSKCVGRDRNIDDIKNEANKLHNNKYDYSKVLLSTLRDKVTIICPEHGEFEQSLSNHLRGSGCTVCNRGWNKDHMIDYIKSLENELNDLDPIELITIINSNNLSRKLKEIGSLTDLLKTQPGTKERKDVIDNVISKIENSNTTDDIVESETSDNNIFNEEITENDNLDSIIDPVSTNPIELLKKTDPIDELDVYDNTKITASLDDENIDFLLKNKLNKLWNSVLNNEVNIDEFKKREGGKNFTIIKDRFFKEYDVISKMEIPSDYIFEYKPNLMQKLITYRLINNKRYANWSGTGAGKTLSAIFAGRYAGVKNTLIICLNSNVNGWINSIHRYFDNSRVFTKKELDSEVSSDKYEVINKYDINFDESKNNYLILNYETFQLENSEYIISELLKNNRIDYIILDEAQNVKQRDEDKQSSRRDVVNKLIIHSTDLNENLMVLPMTATPIINNLIEGKKLIELITGKVHDELETSSTIMNGIEMYKAMTRYGLRYKPNYDIVVNEEIINIDGSHLIDKIVSVPKGSVIDIEKVLLQTKLDGIKDKIKKGTLIYTHYVTELSNNIGEYIEKLGFSVGYYIGDDKRGLELFKKGQIDVLIGSAPVGTGVDGIQYVCDTLIPIVLPWTSSEYEQLKGRIVRQGSKFTSTNIYLPQVTIPLDNGVWSWDIKRYNIIKYKATLADLAVDGLIPDTLIPSRSKLIEDSKKELNDWINRLNNEEIITFEREELRIPLNPKQIECKKIELGDFSTINKTWSVSKSSTTNKRLSDDPSEWYYYHTLYSEARKSWDEIPFIEISKRIKSRPEWIVGDFGCGENLLSKEINNKVYAFDHIAIDEQVIACDIKNVPLDENTLDVVVFSLALMGNNYEDYIKEAKRTLKSFGHIFMCEPLKKWDGRENEIIEVFERNGISARVFSKTNKFIYINGTRID